MKTQRYLTLILLAGLVWTGDAVAQDFATTAGRDFAYCQARGPSCSETSFETSCGTFCSAPCEHIYSQVDQNFDQWRVVGFVDWIPQGGDVTMPVTRISAGGERMSDDLLVLSGGYYRAPGTDVELALLHYIGDPVDLDGETYGSAFDLVGLGLIEPEDILFVKADFSFTDDYDNPYSFEIEVTGIPDEELVIFVGGTGLPNPDCDPAAIPAAGPTGLVVLGLAILTFSYRRLRVAGRPTR